MNQSKQRPLSVASSSTSNNPRKELSKDENLQKYLSRAMSFLVNEFRIHLNFDYSDQDVNLCMEHTSSRMKLGDGILIGYVPFLGNFGKCLANEPGLWVAKKYYREVGTNTDEVMTGAAQGGKRSKKRKLDGSDHIDEEVTYFKMIEKTEAEDISFATNKILKGGSHCPADAMALVRVIVTGFPAVQEEDSEDDGKFSTSSKPNRRKGLEDEFEEAYEKLKDAIKLATEQVTKEEHIITILKWVYLDISYREALNAEGKSPANKGLVGKLLSSNKKIKTLKDYGTRALYIAASMCGRSMFGIAALGIMNLTPSVLKQMKQGQVIAMMKLLNISNNDTAIEKGVNPEAAAAVQFITERLFPGAEFALSIALRQDFDNLTEKIKNFIVLRKGDDIASYGFCLKGRKIFFPNPHLLHSGYKTADLEQMTPSIIAFYDDLAHIQWARHVAMYTPFRAGDNILLQDYKTFWGIEETLEDPQDEEIFTFYPGFVSNPDQDIFTDKEWYDYPRHLAFWYSFLHRELDETVPFSSGEIVKICPYSSEFLGTFDDDSLFNTALADGELKRSFKPA